MQTRHFLFDCGEIVLLPQWANLNEAFPLKDKGIRNGRQGHRGISKGSLLGGLRTLPAKQWLMLVKEICTLAYNLHVLRTTEWDTAEAVIYCALRLVEV
ncbi:hypothetical protein NPIL_7761 [Nephila pilipes]|uniref:Uncharacterized protein n=1 Tax=Nephila pilipes TaxID=299642 RepID=A0A8X6UCT7_NEPPI|nr:hypothetical protein NPIL_519091 [Nephila pilipes]GFU40599.1 hypothetical protein NPIL_7761 [Nephila pilipes]